MHITIPKKISPNNEEDLFLSLSLSLCVCGPPCRSNKRSVGQSVRIPSFCVSDSVSQVTITALFGIRCSWHSLVAGSSYDVRKVQKVYEDLHGSNSRVSHEDRRGKGLIQDKGKEFFFTSFELHQCLVTSRELCLVYLKIKV